jgi:hypothetical protein
MTARDDGRSHRSVIVYAVWVGVGLAFGAADQYLGSRSSVVGVWAVAVSAMSAPWLVLPFVGGTSQQHDRRAMSVGLVVTIAALAGYFAMTCSFVESIPVGRFSSCVMTVARTGYNPLWIVGGILAGPLFGHLGWRWRVSRSWVSAAIVVSALCLEPLARSLAGMPSPTSVAWAAEIAVGAGVGVLFALLILTSKRIRT